MISASDLMVLAGLLAAYSALCILGLLVGRLCGMTDRPLPFETPLRRWVDAGDDLYDPYPDDLSHVTVLSDDRARMVWWDSQRANLDGAGRTLKVGVDVHAGACDTGDGKLECVCPLGDGGAA